MPNISELNGFWVVAMLICTTIVLIGNVYKTIKEWKKPKEDLNKQVHNNQKAIEHHDRELAEIKDGQKILQKGMLSLIDHSITGNSVEKLKQSRDEMRNYLIEK